ncbi:exonuclease domain-containing protein [Asticcacaulis machinosus]|uniref:Exonuclease domain-containing protein n=1 Tax=Asticcacaulis machinosus TaxID=2984211 RepID=A0ABT5HG30_9CAUL|nr:exonuclease domain-containing protein [Asticcacaulis machinosus]MDC7675186.1 exonuclease domain-containing protein [Asticcacaulis machinosus]
MPLIFYDVETTGLNRSFDQILHFAAVKTDDNLVPMDRFEVKSKLLPNVIPAPKALSITGLSLSELHSEDRLSHYEMVREIVQKLTSWGPAIYVGFNSIKFDEEFLRQAFFQTLHPPYFTSLNGNLRGDALHVARATAVVAPGVLQVPTAPTGNPTFALQALAAANNIQVRKQHDAAADVETTIALCALIRSRASNIWSAFLRFVSKQATNAFIANEPAFALLEVRGGIPGLTMAAELGRSISDQNLVHCLDLRANAHAMAEMTDEDLDALAGTYDGVFRSFRTNASPMLWAAWDLDDASVTGIGCDQAEESAAFIADHPQLKARLLALARSKEKFYPQSIHPEERLHGEWISDLDARLSVDFHNLPWEKRGSIVDRMTDIRLKTFAARLAYFERPHLLTEQHRTEISREFKDRICVPASGPWRTASQALEEIATLQLEAEPALKYSFDNLRAYLQTLLTA